MKGIKYFFYYLLQFTWGILQNIGGFCLFLKYRKCKKEFFHGSVIVYHNEKWGGISMGIFIIMNGTRSENWIYDAKIHEYGHTIQSLILGPLYFLVIGVPSFVWRYLTNNIIFSDFEYYEFYPEGWANYLGQAVTGQKMRLNE
ncbi:MAG: hypothetical protein PHI19_00865 [Clostridia bacterium]|nr:hypothetical protein [Clostridia bacterium]